MSLVDSYDTKLSGVKNFICVALVLADHGYSGFSIRLDSGDLADLSKFASTLFDEISEQFQKEAFKHVTIVASNDINEESINLLEQNQHQIDVFGIGTNLVTCQAQPALGMVYKICELKGIPRIKLSEEPGKSTLPGSKQVLRQFQDA